MAGYQEIPARSVLWPLVEALQKVPCMADANGRRLVLRIIGDELGRPFMVDEHSQTTMHLFSIVDACRQSPEGLRALVKALEYVEPGALSTNGVRQIVTQMVPLDSWTHQEQRELFALLAGIIVPDIVEVYRFVAGPNAPKLGDQTTFEEMLLALDTLNAGVDGLPRPLVFVEHLAARVRLDLATKLRNWVDLQATRINLFAELQEVRRQLGRAAIPTSLQPRLPAYIVFLLQYEGLGSRYRLSYWRQLDVTGGWYPERGDDFIGTLDEIKHHVAALIECVESEWANYVPDIRVEFVLPLTLLNLAVDQWQWEVESPLPQPMGCRFSVVVRSLERMQWRKWHRHWYARWAELESQVYSSNSVIAECGYWSRAADLPGLRELTSYFERHGNVVALMLCAPPLPPAFDELMVGLRAGIPVVVWHRKGAADEEFVATVNAFLHAAGTGHLLDRVRVVRSNAFVESDQCHVGAHMTVLWDDPKRVVVPDRPAPPEEVA
ncbi:hypothetical protein JOF56_003580 [Kibdelosporangium banguiense]|uniref:Uncharacterized protein n=1 Tax=Kibdelosporangium banguiense TaxID=1365924 RepID=A0ABS4TGP8_9PSEU|nr:hypothetical protein [Kibdelosporangium banguiense]MBP2323195.1 hypothetical protein [Kibdelosporangium banguiense]